MQVVSIVFVVEWDGRFSEQFKRSWIGVVEVVCGFESVDKDRAAALYLVFDTMEELDMWRVL